MVTDTKGDEPTGGGDKENQPEVVTEVPAPVQQETAKRVFKSRVLKVESRPGPTWTDRLVWAPLPSRGRVSLMVTETMAEAIYEVPPVGKHIVMPREYRFVGYVGID